MGNYMVIHVFIFNTNLQLGEANCHEFITNFYPFSTFL